MLVPLGMRERRLLALDNGCKRGFDNVKTLVELLICDHQWNEDADYIVESSGGDGDEAVLVAILSDGFGFGVGRLARFCVAHQFDGAHSAEAANVADKRPPFLPAPGALFETLADASGTREQAVLLDSFNGGERGGAGSAVTAAMGMPPPRDFAMVIRSGSMPKCSEANHFPVRAKPDCTSSAMKRMPCLRQMFCSSLK